MGGGKRHIKTRHSVARIQRVRYFVVGIREGKTELGYLSEYVDSKVIKLDLSLSTHNPDYKSQIDRTLEAAKKYNAYESEFVIVLAVIDVENMDEASLKRAKQAHEYARSKGVRLIFNTPHIERWLHLAFDPISPYESKDNIERSLSDASASAGVGYVKPGSPEFHKMVVERSGEARQKCKDSRHNDDFGLTCMCELLDLLDSIQGT